MTVLQTTRLNRRALLTGAAAALSIPAMAMLTRRANATTNPKGKTIMEKVRFQSGGQTLVGDLYRPANLDNAAPAIAIVGPMTYQKEQAPTEYAKRLAGMGYLALAYDSRYRGESGGEPRAWENPFHKAEDLVAAVNYLKGRSDANTASVSILGICQGSSVALQAAADATGVKAIATIAGHYRDHEGNIEWLTQAGFDARKAAGDAAKQKFLATGQIDYVKGVDRTDPNVGMPGDFVWTWYQPWSDRGQWENRYAVMSDADLLAYESLSATRRLNAPWLMIHGDNCFLPNAARRHLAALPKTTKSQVIWNDTPHLAYYDQPAAIDAATRAVDDWFRKAA
jgi:uncharacterized protein